MFARLQSMFDVAADLIGSDDLQGTLARITERAAQQVPPRAWRMPSRGRSPSPAGPSP
jgi:hypothetical protein